MVRLLGFEPSGFAALPHFSLRPSGALTTQVPEEGLGFGRCCFALSPLTWSGSKRFHCSGRAESEGGERPSRRSVRPPPASAEPRSPSREGSPRNGRGHPRAAPPRPGLGRRHLKRSRSRRTWPRFSARQSVLPAGAFLRNAEANGGLRGGRAAPAAGSGTPAPPRSPEAGCRAPRGHVHFGWRK